ncbi:MAG: PQQ-binding-like beta-propeller repeat protein [Acidobacteriota bacterium]
MTPDGRGRSFFDQISQTGQPRLGGHRAPSLFARWAFLVTLLSGVMGAAVSAADWGQFRGPNGSGVAQSKSLPVEFGPDKNVVWKTALPPGHSSPALAGNRIFLTAYEPTKLWVLCLDRSSGKTLWRKEVPKNRSEELHKANSPASPTPVTDGKNVYAFFTDFGLISFTSDGEERWRLPLGPFNNPFGLGASPVLANDKVLMICDQESGSFFIAVDQDTGEVKWRVERPEYTRGFATPILYQPREGGLQVLVSGSLQLTAYSVETGREVWWLRGLTWQMKSTPVMNDHTIYVHGWAGGADEGQQEEVSAFQEVLAKWDRNQDGRLSKEEISDEKITRDWQSMDLDRDGGLGERDWRFYRARRSARNAVLAFRLGGQGDMTEKSFLWRYQKSLPNVPSPLLYDNILYLMKEGGILTALDASTGTVLKQARLTGALGDYFASPVAADGKLYTISHEGKASVIRPGSDWEVLAVNDLGDSCNATPAIAEGCLYVRTHGMLYCFGTPEISR